MPPPAATLVSGAASKDLIRSSIGSWSSSANSVGKHVRGPNISAQALLKASLLTRPKLCWLQFSVDPGEALR
jgi:hypothetical protein